jgi:antitoxin MazE
MRGRLTRWGGSLGLRIPQEVARRLGLAAGDEMELALEGEVIVIRVAAPRYRLEDLLVGMTPARVRSLTGPAAPRHA